MDENFRAIDKSITRKIRVIGRTAVVEQFEQFIKPYDNFEKMQEAQVRLIIQGWLDTHSNVRLTVLYDGNTVYAIKPLLKDLKKVVRANDMELLSDALYKFFSLSCGSIAHFNISGWIAEYPTVGALKQFFLRNEYGQSVLANQPLWATDRIKVVQEMQKVLKLRSPRQEHYTGRTY